MNRTITAVKKGGQWVMDNSPAIATGVGTMVASFAAMAALPESVDTAVTAAQTDVLAMIGKGFAYGGAVAGIWVAYKYFRRVIKGG
jgi:hypothetical protein